MLELTLAPIEWEKLVIDHNNNNRKKLANKAAIPNNTVIINILWLFVISPKKNTPNFPNNPAFIAEGFVNAPKKGITRPIEKISAKDVTTIRTNIK